MSDAHDLIACARCSRHAFVRDGRCPFCASELPEPPLDRPRWLGSLTRAAVFYGASALASIACSQPEATPTDPVAESPKIRRPAAVAPEAPPEVALAEADPVTSPEVVAQAQPALSDDEEREHAESGKRRHRAEQQRIADQQRRLRDLQRIRHAMPYGAPPFDFVV